MEVEQLIQDLGKEDATVGEQAARRLKAIGVPALPSLRQTAGRDDTDFTRRVQQLVEEIELTHGLIEVTDPVRASGFEFRLLASPVWPIPLPGQEQPVRLGLKIINCDSDPYCFYLLDTVQVQLHDAQGRLLQVGGGRTGVRKDALTVTRPLGRGESYTVSFFNARLCWGRGGQLTLLGDDGFGGLWYFEGLTAGKYFLNLVYSTSPTPFGDRKHQGPCAEPGGHKAQKYTVDLAVWVGEATTTPCEVEIRQ